MKPRKTWFYRVDDTESFRLQFDIIEEGVKYRGNIKRMDNRETDNEGKDN